jgi:cytochrome c oxidase cbb3-type subunit 3
MRPAGDPSEIARGKALYEINCARCHGADLRGGDLGGPNLLRSQIVMNDQTGERILPVLQSGRPNSSNPSNPPMPAFTFPSQDISAIAAYLHSVTRLLSRTGVPVAGSGFGMFNRLTGDAAAGQTYFAAKCASCHSVTGDLKGIGSRLTDTMELQNYWVAGGAAAGRGGAGAGRGGTAAPKPTTVTLTLPSGQKIEGRLVQADDFVVTLAQADGSVKSFARTSENSPKVEIKDPREAHKKLLPAYTDTDIHDVTAYLATLR